MKIFILDFIGIHSGMNYYNDALIKLLSDKGISVELLSNYSTDSGKPFTKNIFTGNKITKLYRFVQFYLKVLIKVLMFRKNYFIIYFYGGKIDALLLLTTFFSSKIILDIHDVYALDSSKIGRAKYIIDFLISNRINYLISHSDKNKQILNMINYKKEIIEVPHFKYNIDSISTGRISIELEKAIETNKINILFFGNMRLSKGIDILLDTIINIQNVEKFISSFNFIIAGKDNIGISEQYCNLNKNMIKFVLKHIDDNELSYLFKKSDYIILPYREISQSGVLEMAIGYKKPVLLSDIEYFKKYIEKYSSFGLLFTNSQEGIRNVLENVFTISANNPKTFYNEVDYKRYLNHDENLMFVDRIEKILKK